MDAADIDEISFVAGTQANTGSQVVHIIPVYRQGHHVLHRLVPEGYIGDDLFLRRHGMFHKPAGHIADDKDGETVLFQCTVEAVVIHFHAPPMDIADMAVRIEIIHRDHIGTAPQGIITEIIGQRGIGQRVA